jgi:hypothetical protein
MERERPVDGAFHISLVNHIKIPLNKKALRKEPPPPRVPKFGALNTVTLIP